MPIGPETPVEYLKGVGPQRAETIQKELGIFHFSQLLRHYPFRYIDRSKVHKIKDIPQLGDVSVQLDGKVQKIQITGKPRRQRLVVQFSDGEGMVTLNWFKGIKWIQPKLKVGQSYRVFGKPVPFGGSYTINHPDFMLVSEAQKLGRGLEPIYHSTEKMTQKGLHSKGIQKIIQTNLMEIKGKFPEVFPSPFKANHNLMDSEAAIYQVHIPKDIELLKKARYRLKFEELFFLQLELLFRKEIAQKKLKGAIFDELGNVFLDFYDNVLPFELTGAQKKVIKEIRRDMKSGHQMNRLLQGDVGSGKTLVAFLSALIVIGNQGQAALMAPTEILAQQHYESALELLPKVGVRVGLLTGSTKKSERKILHENLRSGTIDLLIGTHALIEDEVQFNNLSLVIIDEQHRFGVAQRARLWRKNQLPPHILVMTATPIPRTLAMTLYGDLDVSVIDELPPGRKPVLTRHLYEKARLEVFSFIESEITKGRQIYIVYPLIEESETLDYNNLMEGYEAISRRFPLPKYKISVVHGRMKAKDKDFEMQRFAKGETQIMVATTVIEVGVNVPNASVMVIENSEKFGLSQLHQLRGRVGRGAEKSYCILMTGNKVSQNAKKRLSTMCASNDGFKISEVDLEIRGPGDLMGTQQSGLLDLKIADLARDGAIITSARAAARAIIAEDPDFKKLEHQAIGNRLKNILASRPNWGRIS